jgi:hypothetical protein
MPGQKPGVLIISRTGRRRRLSAGISQMGYPPLWGEHAPALVVPPWKGPAELLFLNGKTQKLPAGWQAWAWNEAGNELLMLKGTTLGVWSMTRPHAVAPIGAVSPGFEIEDVSWLSKKAPL